ARCRMAGPLRCRKAADRQSATCPGSLRTGTRPNSIKSSAQPGSRPLKTAISAASGNTPRSAIPSSIVATKNRRHPAAAKAGATSAAPKPYASALTTAAHSTGSTRRAKRRQFAAIPARSTSRMAPARSAGLHVMANQCAVARRAMLQELPSGLFHRVVRRAVVAGMQGGRDENPIRVGAGGKWQRQASDKGLLGAVIGVLAPRQIAEPACGPMTTLNCFREVAKERRRPSLQQVAIEAKPALAPADDHIPGDQRISDPLLGRNHPIRIAFPQPKRGKDDALRSREGNQLAQNQCRERHDVEAPARDRGDSLERFARLPADDIEETFGLPSRNRVPMNDVERILRVLHVEPGDRARRSADQIQLSSGGGAQNRSAGERPVDRFGQNLRPIPEFGKAERAERETDALAYLTGSAGNGIRCAGSNTNQLDAPAAEIGD